jgi:uncharacterized protein (DUF2236 family)
VRTRPEVRRCDDRILAVVAQIPPLPHLTHLDLCRASRRVLTRVDLPRPPAMPSSPQVGSALRDGVDEARARMARSMRRLIVGDDTPPRHLGAPGDPGLFGPESVTWRIHADPAMFIGGLRALLLQTMHPLAMAGVADHSDYRRDPMGRLWRTSTFIGVTTYGSTDEALDAVATVKEVHARITGVAPDGRSYAANDKHLLTWVHHAEVDSFLAAYRRYGSAPLSDADADRYVEEMAVICDLLDAEPAARSVVELDAYFHAVGPELRATPAARDAVRFLLVPPLPLPARLAYAVIAPAAVGLLPGWVQRALWLPVLPGADPVAVRPAARALTRLLGWIMAGYQPPSASGPPDLRAVDDAA